MTYQHAIQRLRSATMAPKRTPAKTKADDTDDKDSLSQPTSSSCASARTSTSRSSTRPARPTARQRTH